MTENLTVANRSVLQQILELGRHHWDNDNYDPNARHRFQQALQCKSPALGKRVYASGTEEREFPNTCKSLACASCGHWACIQWQRRRWCALPECRYCAITFTMPNTLWPLFAANPRLCRKLAEIAARVIESYARVHKGVEVGVIPIVQTFNGKLEFNSHVHVLVTARDFQAFASAKESSVFFDGNKLKRMWQRLVIALLRTALETQTLMAREELKNLLDYEGKRSWIKAHVQAFDGKEHFLRYAGRYVRRPPIAQRRIVSVTNGLVRFWYKDKRSGETEALTLSVEEFIDRWAQHFPERHRHTVRYFGLFASRSWSRIGAALFALVGTTRPLPPNRRRWAPSIERQFGRNPLLDSAGVPMRLVRHVPPLPTT